MLGNIIFIKENLPLQVIEFDVVTVCNYQMAYSGPAQVVCQACAQGTTTYNCYSRLLKASLSGLPNWRKEGLPRIAFRFCHTMLFSFFAAPPQAARCVSLYFNTKRMSPLATYALREDSSFFSSLARLFLLYWG
jgi:hypothetical protein